MKKKPNLPANALYTIALCPHSHYKAHIQTPYSVRRRCVLFISPDSPRSGRGAHYALFILPEARGNGTARYKARNA